MQTFDRLLRTKIKASGQSLVYLATTTGIPKTTLNNWQHGLVRSPREWRGIVRLAAALHLDRVDADRLLVAAGHPPLGELRAGLARTDDGLLDPWRAELQRTIPLQLPRTCETFVDRAAELAYVEEQLAGGGSAVVIDGMPGAGKSELAVRAAMRVRPSYPGGIVWDGPGSSSLEATIAALAHGFGIHLDARMSTASRAAALRSSLSGSRCLVVFDGVEDMAGVEALLPPRGSRYSALLTTQDARTAPRLGLPRVSLEGFDRRGAAALDLYAQVLGSTAVTERQAAFEGIARACGQLPLALAITAWQLEAGLMQAEDILELLGSHEKLDALEYEHLAVRKVLDLAVRNLSQGTQGLLRILSVFPGHDVSDRSVAAVARSELAIVRKGLLELQSRSLLLPGRQRSRFRLHALVRDFVRAGHDTSELQQRFLCYIVETAEAHRYDSFWFAEEESHFEGALRIAREQDQPAWLVRGVVAMSPYWVQSGFLDRARRRLEDAYALTDALDAPRLRARVRHWLAQVEDQMGGTDRAMTLARGGLQELQAHALPDESCALTIALASGLVGQNELDQAETLLTEALTTARDAGLHNRACDALLELGVIARNRGRPEEARERYEEGTILAEELGDRDRLRGFTNNLGVVEADLGNYEAAERRYAAAAELCREHGDADGLSRAHLNLGTIATYLGDLLEAERHYWQGLEIARRIRSTETLVTAYTNVAVAAANLGDLGKAEWYLLKAYVVALRDQRQERLLVVLETLGGVATASGRLVQAVRYYEAEREHASRSEQRLFEANACARLGEVHTQLGNWMDAESLLSHASELMREIKNARGLTEVLHYRAQLHHVLGEMEQARDAVDVALRQARELGHRERLCQVLATSARCALADEEVDAAREAARESLEIARAISHPFSLAESLSSLAEIELATGRLAAAETAFAEEAAIGAEVGYRLAEARGLFGLARAQAARNPQSDAVRDHSIRSLSIFRDIQHFEASEIARFLQRYGLPAD